MKLDELLSLARVRPDVKVNVPPLGDVYIKHPTASDWSALTMAHQKLNGESAPMSLVCRTIATCLADADGNLIFKSGEAHRLGDADASVVMRLYEAVVTTVFPIDEKRIKDAEGNCEASR